MKCSSVILPKPIEPIEPIGQEIEPPSEYEKNLAILKGVEASIIDRMRRFPDQIIELNSQLINAQSKREIFEKFGGAEKSVIVYEGEIFDSYYPPLLNSEVCENLDNGTRKMAGVINFGGGMFTNSLVTLAKNVDEVFSRTLETKGLAKNGSVARFKELANLYNDAAGFVAYDVNYFNRI